MYSFIDLDTPLLLAEDPVIQGYEGTHVANLNFLTASLGFPLLLRLLISLLILTVKDWIF